MSGDIVERLRALRRRHHVSQDCWYTCPKAVEDDPDEHCCDDERPYVCDCGAEAHNAEVDGLVAEIWRLRAALRGEPRPSDDDPDRKGSKP